MRLLHSVSFRVFLAIASGVGTWYVLVLVAPYLHIKDPLFVATALMVSVFIHELGHVISFKRHGIPSLMFFVVVLGGAMPLDEKKAEQLSDAARAEIALAGLFGNALIMALVAGGYFIGLLSEIAAGRIININASLMLFNMIPISIFDGSRFMKILFRNISPQFGRLLFHITSIPVIFAMMLLLYLRGDVTLALPLILLGIYRRSRVGDNAEVGGQPMTKVERLVWAIAYTYLVCAALIAFVLTPDWHRI